MCHWEMEMKDRRVVPSNTIPSAEKHFKHTSIIYCWCMERKDLQLETTNTITSTAKDSQHTSVHLLLGDRKRRSPSCDIKLHHINREAYSAYFCSCAIERWKYKIAGSWHPSASHQPRTTSNILLSIYCRKAEREDRRVVTSKDITSTEKNTHETFVHLLLRDGKGKDLNCYIK